MVKVRCQTLHRCNACGKNVCDSIIGTLLSIKGKTNDGINARKDLVEIGVRLELQPQPHGKRTYLPPACHTLSKFEKISFCGCLRGFKVPQGYSSNIKSLVSMEDLKLMGLKSHDCHVLMQDLLPVPIRGILPKNVRQYVSIIFYMFANYLFHQLILLLTLIFTMQVYK